MLLVLRQGAFRVIVIRDRCRISGSSLDLFWIWCRVADRIRFRVLPRGWISRPHNFFISEEYRRIIEGINTRGISWKCLKIPLCSSFTAYYRIIAARGVLCGICGVWFVMQEILNNMEVKPLQHSITFWKCLRIEKGLPFESFSDREDHNYSRCCWIVMVLDQPRRCRWNYEFISVAGSPLDLDFSIL